MTTIPLSQETQRRLDALFVGSPRQQAAALLVSLCGNNLPFLEASDAHELERIRFAALKLSDGNVAKLEQAVQLAQQDWRDVLVGWVW